MISLFLLLQYGNLAKGFLIPLIKPIADPIMESNAYLLKFYSNLTTLTFQIDGL